MNDVRTDTWDAGLYATHARFVSDLGMPVVELLDPCPGERILDLGCGDGVLTRKLMDLGCTVVGVDASADMVRAAKALGVDAYVQSGQSLVFEAEFDAVFSNAALHWMQPAEAVIGSVFRALKPGGRFVGEMGGAGNNATVVDALSTVFARRGLDASARNPWFFPDVPTYTNLLSRAGFVIDTVERFPRPTPLPGSLAGWLATFGGHFLQGFATDEQAAIVSEVETLCRPLLCDAQGRWTADYVRLRFRARKPGT